MTKEEAIKIYRTFGLSRIERDFRLKAPSWWCDQVLTECAQDTVEGLIALGVLVVEPPQPSPQGKETADQKE